MPAFRFYAASIINASNLTGSPSQIQDDPDNPDNDWMLSTDPALECLFTIVFDISAAPPENISNADWRFAMFLRNSRDSGQSADWGGEIRINGAAQIFTRIAVPSSANPTDGGIKQDQVANLAGGQPLVSMELDIDVVKSGGSPNARTSLDFDSIEVILQFDDPPVFVDLVANGIGTALGGGTMDILPEDLGTADGTGVAVGTATAQLVPLTELSGTGAGAGTGTATADLVPPLDLAATGNGAGIGIGDLDQLPYNFPPAAGLGLGNGDGILQQTATPIDIGLTITEPDPGNVTGLVTIQAVEDDPSVPLVSVLINPAHERDPFGYLPDRESPKGTHEYDWSSTPYILTQQEIEATAIFMGLRTGQGPSGFQITGAFGSESLADNAPVLVDVLDGSAPELQGLGVGFGTGTGTLDLIAVTELGTAVAGGVGTGDAGAIDIDLTGGAGVGAGEGLATLTILLGIVASQGDGVGTGEGTLDIVLPSSGGGGNGVGTGLATILVIRDLGFGHGNGQGLSNGVLDVLLDIAGDGTGVGTGLGVLSLVEGVLWQDPATGTNGDPWNPVLWETFVQTGASTTATATIQSNTNELTNDTVNAGGAYHEAIHAPFDSVRLDVDLVQATTNPTVDSQQAVYVSASGAPDANGVPADGLRVLVIDPAAGTLEARVQKIIGGVITTLSTFDISTFLFPLSIALARSGGAWGASITDIDVGSVVDSGDDLELQDIPAGVVWVNTYSLGTADYQWDDFILTLVPFYNMSGSGLGVGTGTGNLTAEFIDMNARAIGQGTGIGVMDVGIFLVSNAVGVGTGTGTLDLKTMTGEAFGIGTGTGFLSVDKLFQGGGIGVGTGTGKLIFSTGEWFGAGAKVPAGSADAVVPGGGADANVPGGGGDAGIKGDPSDAETADGTATVTILGDSSSVEGP